MERLSEFIPQRIDVLLGGDFLGLMPFTIDFSGIIHWWEKSPAFSHSLVDFKRHVMRSRFPWPGKKSCSHLGKPPEDCRDFSQK
jgi:hypothetical protein